jgi:hypothetical protein
MKRGKVMKRGEVTKRGKVMKPGIDCIHLSDTPIPS